MQSDILNTEVTTIDGEKTTLEGYKGKVLLIVNVASKCGLTPQYEQLENIHKAWEKDGFTVLGFPCNQFLGQEPGSEEEIKTFCSTTYGVTFPMFSKIDVNGENRHPLYAKLVAAAPTAVAPEESGFYERMASKGRAPLYPDDILWNFEKFLIGRDGEVVQRFSPDMTPEDPIVMESIKLALLTDVAGKGRLEPVTAEVNAGEILHLVGPNGAGKSTLLACMAGLTSGEGDITFLGQSLGDWLPATLASRRSYLVQQQVPPFAMPVWHYLTLHLPDKNQVGLLNEVAAALGLDDKLTRQANQLSGGEWQRVRLAAVILQIHPAGNPHGRLLLLDEPMSGLDVAQQAALDTLLSALCRKGIAIVMSSHDLNHTLRHAHRVWLLARGKLIASGTRDSVLTAANLASAYHMSFRRLDIEGHKMLISTAQE